MIDSSTGAIWLIAPTSPMVAKTPEIASSSGTPAATSAPNAITSTTSVSGSEVNSAFLKSSSKLWLIALSELASPNASTRSPLCARCAAATAPRASSTLFSVSSGSPGMS